MPSPDAARDPLRPGALPEMPGSPGTTKPRGALAELAAALRTGGRPDGRAVDPALGQRLDLLG